MGTRCCFTVRTCKLSSTTVETKQSDTSRTTPIPVLIQLRRLIVHSACTIPGCSAGAGAGRAHGQALEPGAGRSSSPWRRTCAGPRWWHNGQNLLIAQCRFLAASGLDSTKELVNLCIYTLFIYTRTEEDSVGLQPAREQLARAPRVLTAAAPVPAAVARPQEYSCNSTRKTAGPRAAGVSPLSRPPLQCQPSGRPQAPCTS